MRVPSEGSPLTRHLKRPGDENERTVVEMSQTQEDSQGLICRLSIAHPSPNLYLLPPLALTFWQPSASSQCERAKDLSLESCSPARKHSLALQSPPPTKRPRRCVEHIPEPASPPVQAISRYKRAHGVEPPAINAEFEINPTSNAGVPFAFDEVVRGRLQRQALNAGECEECRDVRVYSFHKKKKNNFFF